MRRGLVFGKFMPLHRGHQLLIERALAEVDDLTIVVYDGEPIGDYPPMPIELRLRWLRELHPDVEAIVPVDDPEKTIPTTTTHDTHACTRTVSDSSGSSIASSRASRGTSSSRMSSGRRT